MCSKSLARIGLILFFVMQCVLATVMYVMYGSLLPVASVYCKSLGDVR